MFVGMTACLPAMAVARVAAPWLRRLQPAEDDDGAAEPLLGLGKRSPSPSPLSRRSPAALPSTPSLAPLLGLGSRSPAATPGTATPGSLASATTSFTGGDAAAAAAALWGNAAAATDGGASVPLKRALALILIPTAFDLVASMLLAVGLLFVSASAFQMVRGSEVAFAALLSAACLGRRLNRLHIGGIAACMVSWCWEVRFWRRLGTLGCTLQSLPLSHPLVRGRSLPALACRQACNTSPHSTWLPSCRLASVWWALPACSMARGPTLPLAGLPLATLAAAPPLPKPPS